MDARTLERGVEVEQVRHARLINVSGPASRNK
jgi:hypothetical protein